MDPLLPLPSKWAAVETLAKLGVKLECTLAITEALLSHDGPAPAHVVAAVQELRTYLSQGITKEGEWL